MVSDSDKKISLERALKDISSNTVFLGHIFQSLTIKYCTTIPTAGVMFDGNSSKFIILLNEEYFCNTLRENQRKAVLYHELEHILRDHLSKMIVPKDEINILNVAADMEINQYIQGLPLDCVNVDNYFEIDNNGNRVPWDRYKSIEFYFFKLKQWFKEHPEDIRCSHDIHIWEDSDTNINVKKSTLEDLIKRAMDKSNIGYSELPTRIKDTLDNIGSFKSSLDYRSIILSAIKRSASGFDIKKDWSRHTRRFDEMIVPGSRSDNLPKLDIYLDSSGSISVKEMEEFLNIVDDFIRVGARKCTINLFHTTNYYRKPYKRGSRACLVDNIESGGTNLEDTLRTIFANNSDLSIILTDGIYSDVNYDRFKRTNAITPKIIFLISKDGNKNHPLIRLGRTILSPNSG